MRHIKTFLLLIIITSCNLNQKTESNLIFGKDIDGMFGILSTKCDESIMFLKDDIHAKILRNDFDSLSLIKIQKYDKLTKDYLKYLNGIEKQFAENNVNPFFTNGQYSNKGIEYLEKTKLYESELLKFAENNQIKKKISLKIGAYNVIAINGYEVKHLDYYFDDLPHKGIITYLKLQQQNILELEKDFLNEILIEPEQNPTANTGYKK